MGVLGVDITHPFFEQFLEGDWESGSTEGEGGDREQRLRRGSSSGSGGGGSSVVMAGVHITHNSNRNMEWRTSRHRSDQPNDELSRISTRSTNRSDHTTTTASSEGGGVELGGASVGVELTRFSTVDSGSSSALSSLATRRSRNIDPRVKQRASSGTFG